MKQMCQLQISLYNKGVFEALAALEALDERQYQTKVRRLTEDCPWQDRAYQMTWCCIENLCFHSGEEG
jgi:hypothetical protein